MTDGDEAAEVRQIWSALGLPGVIDVHTHFMPKSVLDKVWRYFDSGGQLVGRKIPITYRAAESRRVQLLRQFGVRAFTALVYPHRPQMAAWLNQWAAEFSHATPDCLATATFYPEPEAGDYVEAAIRDGTQVFKAHVQVGRYEPNDPLLDHVWGVIEDAGVPVVIHCVPDRCRGTTPGLSRFVVCWVVIRAYGLSSRTWGCRSTPSFSTSARAPQMYGWTPR